MAAEVRVPRPLGRKPVVVCFRPATAPELAKLDLNIEVVEWVAGEEPPEGRRADLCLGGNLLPDEAVAWADGARWVHLTGVGTDNVPVALMAGRTVTNSPGLNAAPVAEFAFACVLAAAKRLPDVWAAPADAHWSQFKLDTLEGRTLGLIGYGHIAQEIARRAVAFGMEVVVHTRTARQDTQSIRFVGLHEVAAVADHLVVAATATPETHHLVGHALLSATRTGVHLVNVSRGSLVDQDALRPFLDSGQVSRATLDTVDPEPLPEGHWLREHPRVFVSPHIAASSPNATRKVVARFEANLRRYLDGEPLVDVVQSPVAKGAGAGIH